MQYKTIDVEGLSTFYRECGSKDKPVMLLLHGTATSSYMFCNLMPLLGQTFHVIAPDYIGCGNSAAPDHTKFNYTYEHLTDYLDALLEELRVEKFYMYVFDDGAPIGFNLARRHPYNILGIVSQNGNIYQEGLGPEWNERQQYWKKPTQELREKYKAIFSPDAIKSLYLTGEKDNAISPDGYAIDIYNSQKDNDFVERQSDLLVDYQNNVKNYSDYQNFLRKHHPDLIVAWGRNDPRYIYPGALAFQRDDSDVDIHLLNAGHFALESHYEEIADLICNKWGK